MAENEKLIQQVQELEKEQTPEQRKKKNKRHIFNILLVLIITGLAIFLTVKDNFSEIVENLRTCDPRWILVAFGVLLVGLFIRAFIVFLFARLYTRRYHLPQAFAVDFIGTFYNAVTPGASGGQVMQAYTLKKQGIAISSAVSMLAMSSIIYQIVLILYGIAAFVLKNDLIMAIGYAHFGQIGTWNIDIPIWALTIIGFLLNIGVIMLVLLMGYWRGFHNFIMGPVINLLHKLHIVKNPDKHRENLRVQVENFKVEMRRLFSNIPFTILVTILNFAYLTVRFSIPYFIGIGLGNDSIIASFWDCVLLSNYHQMITGIIPIPGSAGVSEIVFRMLFVANEATAENSFFFVNAAGKYPSAVQDLINLWESDPDKYSQFITGKTDQEIYATAVTELNTQHSTSMANAALLLWRSMTFIIPVLVSGIVTAFYHASPKKEIEEAGVPNRQTFLDLQRDTYVARKEELDTMTETARLTREEIARRLKSIGQGARKKKKKEDEKSQPSKRTNGEYDEVKVEEDEDDIIR